MCFFCSDAEKTHEFSTDLSKYHFQTKKIQSTMSFDVIKDSEKTNSFQVFQMILDSPLVLRLPIKGINILNGSKYLYVKQHTSNRIFQNKINI